MVAVFRFRNVLKMVTEEKSQYHRMCSKHRWLIQPSSASFHTAAKWTEPSANHSNCGISSCAIPDISFYSFVFHMYLLDWNVSTLSVCYYLYHWDTSFDITLCIDNEGIDIFDFCDLNDPELTSTTCADEENPGFLKKHRMVPESHAEIRYCV